MTVDLVVPNNRPQTSRILIRFVRPASAPLWPDRLLGGSAPSRGQGESAGGPAPSGAVSPTFRAARPPTPSHYSNPLVQAG
jgi:hypothetical protein